MNASAAGADLLLGYDDTTFDVDTATFRLFDDSFASWPDTCVEMTGPGGFDQVVHCAASEVDSLRATFGPGNDTVIMQAACYVDITVAFGDGGNRMDGDQGCDTRLDITSGAGDDQVTMASGGGTTSLGAGNDLLGGGDGADVVVAGPGNDSIDGRGGNDRLEGQDGNDIINGGAGNDVQSGGNGDDAIGGNLSIDVGIDDDQGADDVSGGPGVDRLLLGAHTGGGVAVTLDGIANDGIAGEGDNFRPDLEQVFGTPFDDTMVGSAANEALSGSSGRDTIDGAGGDDTVDGGADDDTITGGDGNDTVIGSTGNDLVTGGAGTDNLYGDLAACCVNNGNDKVFAVDGEADAVNCGGGADSVEVDQFDAVGADGNQICEVTTRTTVSQSTVELTVTTKIGQSSRRKGVLMMVTCTAACTTSATLKITKKLARKVGLGKKTVIGRGTGSVATSGASKVKIKIKVSGKVRRKLARAGTIRALVVLVTKDAAGVPQAERIRIKLRP